MANNKTYSTQNSRITSVNRKAGREWLQKEHSFDGVHFLSGTSAAPSGKYYGFIVTGDPTEISSITYYKNSTNNDGKVSGDITSITLVQGGYYPIPGGFTTITLSTGDMILLKDNRLEEEYTN